MASKVHTLARLSEDALLPALRVLLELDRVLAEPSGAAGVAALLSGQVRGHGPVVVVVTGANVTMAHLAQVLDTPLPAGLAGG